MEDENMNREQIIIFNMLKNYKPQLKTLITLRDDYQELDHFSKMVSDKARRDIFIDSVMEFIVSHGFDGINMLMVRLICLLIFSVNP